jgi:nucleotide-binding universal stress UspA family protein
VFPFPVRRRLFAIGTSRPKKAPVPIVHDNLPLPRELNLQGDVAMAFKTILVHVDDSAHAGDRIKLAAQMAIDYDAHLIGASTTGMSRQFFKHVAADDATPDLEKFAEILRSRASHTLEKFEAITKQLGVASVERRVIEEEISSGLAMHARYCDLAIIGQADPHDTSRNVNIKFPEIVVLESGGPVLILPFHYDYQYAGKRILIAWNASPAIRKAIQFALPLLYRAEVVQVVIFNAETHPEVFGESPGTDIAQYLARHGITVEIIQRTVKTAIGNALISLSESLGSDLIVMGCYGHARLREIVLGGTTRTVFKSMTVPVFMTH